MRERLVLSPNSVVTILQIFTCKKVKVDSYLTSYTKINPKLIKYLNVCTGLWVKPLYQRKKRVRVRDLNVIAKIIKYLEENIHLTLPTAVSTQHSKSIICFGLPFQDPTQLLGQKVSAAMRKRKPKPQIKIKKTQGIPLTFPRL